MPTNFLGEDQRRRFGRFAEDPDEGQLAGCFLLDQTARRRAMAARGAGNRIGWAVQPGLACGIVKNSFPCIVSRFSPCQKLSATALS